MYESQQFKVYRDSDAQSFDQDQELLLPDDQPVTNGESQPVQMESPHTQQRVNPALFLNSNNNTQTTILEGGIQSQRSGNES